MSASIETIRAALEAIPADLPRDEWARIAMALKSELGQAGFDLFDAWSQQGASYDAKAARETWRSVKAGGRVSIGTLFHVAKAHGFHLDTAAHGTKPSAEERKAAAQARAQREASEREARETAQQAAAAEAVRLWEQASEDGTSGYLARKGVRGHGVRFGADGWLLVPMHDASGALWNVQRIAPDVPTSGPGKLFLKGGRKSGLWHCIGDPTGAPVLLLCEGYATGASLHDATGRPVVVAFDAGNMQAIARAVAKAYRPGLVIVCGDDDRDTEARTGRNPGREKARAAAKQVRGAAVFPEGLAEGKTDFNDMALQGGGDAVRDVIERTIAEATQARSEAGKRKADDQTQGQQAAWLDRFSVNADGVWYVENDNEGRPRAPVWVCSRLEVPALTRDADGQGWGYLLEFADPAGHPRQWAMPARMLAGDGNEFRGILMAFGLRIAATSRARALLAQYIQTRQPEELARCTDRLGWHGRAFVLPGETLGNAGERIVYQTDGAAENTLRQRGTLAQWREHVGSKCVGNSRLLFAVACAFAGPMLRPAGIDSGGFHLRGDSSCGKTTALRIAASVYGGASYMQRWRSTDNALEATAAQHCDGLLILDELAQVEARVAGDCAYMLANESSKARSTRAGQARPRLTWRLLFLSAGEIGLAAHMAEGNKRARAGQELRMADVPADAGAGLGIFDQLHGTEGGAAFALRLAKACEAFHGAAGRAFLEWAVTHADTLRERMREASDRIADEWIPDAASGQVQRVGRRFAVVAAAGELATAAGVTGWPVGEATRGVRACFHAWLESRGGIGNAEEGQIIRQVRRFFEAHGEGRFTEWSRADDDHAPKTLHRAGYRKASRDSAGDVTAWEFFVFVETFRSEICDGFDYKYALRILRDREHLAPDKGRSFDCRVRVPGVGLMNCYRIKSSIFDALGDD